MRIAIDIRDLQIAKTGSRTVLEELCMALPQVTTEHEFVFLEPRVSIKLGKSFWHKIIAHISFYWWKEVSLPLQARVNKCDLIFCTDYVVPYFSHCRTVPVFFDGGFWERPQNYNKYWLKLLNLLAVPAACKAWAVITISESAKERIVKTTKIPASKIEVVYIAPKRHVTRLSEHINHYEVLKRYGVNSEIPFVLHVGVMEKRKNLTRLIQSFAQAYELFDSRFQLVLVGQPGPKKDMDDSQNIKKTIQKHELEKKVILTGYVPDEDLASFYQCASIYAFPSLYEGFGLPILEAFANNLPVMVANSTSLPEVAGDAALIFDPLDSDDIVNSMVRLANDDALRSKLIVNGQKRLQEFSWQRTAAQLVHIFEQGKINQ